MTEKKPRKTVGKIAYDLMNTEEKAVPAVQIQQDMQEDYMKNIMQCIDDNYDKYPQAFFVVVLTKMEKLMTNVIRNYFFARQSCPTPTYDQTVFRYNKDAGSVEYLWTVPSKDACELYLDNARHVVEEEKQLLAFVIAFEDGTLLKVAKKWNKEMPDSILLAES